MLIVLPPSEGKSTPVSGPTLDLEQLSYPSLNPTRAAVLDPLAKLCTKHPKKAAQVLGLGPTQANEVRRNAQLAKSPCAPAIDVYTGVVFEAFDYATLTRAAKARADRSIVIASALWGLVRPSDVIPAYRLGASVSLPGLGTMRSVWAKPLGSTLADLDDLVLDLRSGAYHALAPIPADAVADDHWVCVRVFQMRNGKRTIVSHFNKATKGLIARAAVCHGKTPTHAPALLTAMRRWGFDATFSEDDPATIDVVMV